MSDVPHILLLEDSVDAAMALSRLLTRSGFRVTVAGTLNAAIRAVEEHELDLAIADLALPDGSGVDLLPALRRRGATPAVALTGYDDVDASRAAGFCEHLTKPIQFSDLLALARRLCVPVSR
jgi:DNA-binding response OmpR family regulator